MTPELFGSGFSSAEHLNERIHFPKRSAASSCALVKQLGKLSSCLFLVPTSGHKFIYSPSETTVLLLRKSWFTTAKLIRVPGAEQICEAVDTKCHVFVIICGCKSNLCLRFGTNSCDSAFQKHHK